MDLEPYQPLPCVSYNGFLFKTASMTRAVTERKAKEGTCKNPKTLKLTCCEGAKENLSQNTIVSIVLDHNKH